MMITWIILGALAVLVTWMVIRTKRQMAQLKDLKDNEKIKILDDQNFNAKTKTGMVLVDFWASWCMPCKLMVPVLNELADEANGKVTIGKLDVDASKATASKFGIRSIPTMILFKNGKEIHRFVGVKSKDYLLKEIERRSIYS